MSYYPDMLISPPEGYKQFYLMIGQHGDAVAFRLGEGGRVVGFVQGRVEEVIGEALKESCPIARVYQRLKSNPDYPHTWGFYFDTWVKTAAVMNGKGKRSGKACERYRLISEMFDIGYIKWSDDSREYAVTEKGRKADADIAALQADD